MAKRPNRKPTSTQEKTKDKPKTASGETTPSRCKCGSTRRGPYHNVVTRAIAGEDENGPYTHVVWARTECLDCGQHRRDRRRENRTKRAA